MQEDSTIAFELRRIQEALQAESFAGTEPLTGTVDDIYASDLMSDVLAYGKPGSCLLTGLNTVQAVISSYMAEFKAIVFLRGKVPGDDIRKFASDKGILLFSTRADMYEACIKIAQIDGRLLPSAVVAPQAEVEKNVTRHHFTIDGSDFAAAGLVSTNIKTILKEIGYDLGLIRRIAISVYEGEMNVVMHAERAAVTLSAGDSAIEVEIDDEGKGIPDIEQAMKEGYSTATEEQRAMGFGAGMGLPNIKKNSDNLDITSEVGKGTKLVITFKVNN